MIIKNIVITDIGGSACRLMAALACLALPAQAAELNVAAIREDAFTGARGVIAVNQTAGNFNAQSNSVAISAGPAALSSDALLVAQRPGASGRGANTPSRNVVELSGNAFRSASGIVQINQIAGEGNVVHNAVSLRVLP